jgi:23S rRNA (uracil1939-C5)-methyltransferase
MIAVDDIVELNIDSVAFEGKSIARVDGFVIFVAGGVPGDVVKAKIYKKKKDYAEAKLVEVVHPSPHRVDAPCKYFGICGGCRWQHIDYAEQLRFKRQHVIDALERTGGIKMEVGDIVGAEETYRYRNKIEVSFSNKPYWIHQGDPATVALGFHAPGRFDKTIDIDHCYLADEGINAVINWFRRAIDPDSSLRKELGLTIYESAEHTGLLRFLTIRKSFHTGEYMVNLVVLNESDAIDKLTEKIHADLPFLSTFATIVNSSRAQVATGEVRKINFGEGYITEKLGKYKFRISPLSFFQTNTLQAGKLYDAALNGVGEKQKVIYDLYSGTGSISIYLSEFADHVYGFELVPSAVHDAGANARLNGITNVSFFQTDLLDLFKGRNPLENFDALNIPRPDLILLDPPRSGLHPKIASNLHLLGAETVVYVSCNPMTQARDLKEIVSHGYSPVYSRPVDMFPQTYHIENVVTLRKK